jgi:hypothetical protein
LAAVDNGVLQVSDFETPDPYNYFYAKRALEVNAFDIYPLLLPEIKPKLSSTGGDTESDMTRRVNPMPAKRFKIVSYWSGIKKTDGSGEAAWKALDGHRTQIGIVCNTLRLSVFEMPVEDVAAAHLVVEYLLAG